MLINLTNHPSAGWSLKQKEEAERLYGTIVDLPFPQIEPDAGPDEINRLADGYCRRCGKYLQKSDESANAVHLMGELTFSFALAVKLISKGVKCVASVTRRIAAEENGEKISRFEFGGFREYNITSEGKCNEE